MNKFSQDIGKGYFRVVFSESGCLGVVKNTAMREPDVEEEAAEIGKQQKMDDLAEARREELKKRREEAELLKGKEELAKNKLKRKEELQKRIETKLLKEKALVLKE